jgi:hypothetical protein
VGIDVQWPQLHVSACATFRWRKCAACCMLLKTAAGSSRMSSDDSWISRLGKRRTSIKFGKQFRLSCKLVCASSANLFPCYPAILKGYPGRYAIVKARAVNLQTTWQYSVNNGRASWQLFEPCKARSANDDNHFYVTELTIVNRLLDRLANSASCRYIGFLRLKTFASIAKASLVHRLLQRSFFPTKDIVAVLAIAGAIAHRVHEGLRTVLRPDALIFKWRGVPHDLVHQLRHLDGMC